MKKFCILSAGKGTRNSNIVGLHKALLPLENKPVISLAVLVEHGGKGSIEGSMISRKIFEFVLQNELIQ